MIDVTETAKKRTTLYLPTWLHRAIKTEAAQTDRDMTDIIIGVLAPRYINTTSTFFSPETSVKLVENMTVTLDTNESTQNKDASAGQG